MWSLRHIHLAGLIGSSLVGMGHAAPQGPSQAQCPSGSPDLNWYAPNKTMVNDLSTVLNGTGIYGYVFNTSQTPSDIPYSTYNWCNMPHARSQEYVVPDSKYQLQYVEVIHRHHKRTPYQSNTFPLEQFPWLCDDESLYYYGAPDPTTDNKAAQIAWSIFQSPTNPFKPTGYQNSTCQFPQITAEGLYDARQHGKDLYSVYHDTLNFLPSTYDPTKITFRVTNNVITSQTASQIAIGMFPSTLTNTRLPATVQPLNVDSLEPQYSCPSSTSLYASYGVTSSSPGWTAHLTAPQTTQLFSDLDSISNVNRTDPTWHSWFDHYFDNLSAKLCHDKPLPCNISNPSLCVTDAQADAVFRRGLYEYSYIYRDAGQQTLNASTSSFGVYVAELAHNLRAAISGSDTVKWRHNVAHDGSVSRLLSILQIDVMVWPGMGSEVVFELWKGPASQCMTKNAEWYLRVLWKGQVLRSSKPMFGAMDMVPVDTFLGYVDGLVGVDAVKVPGLCKGS